ncbi:histone-lysine N-methyltransferase SETMAR [Elysia marginata]|uniref:Histone-lysine N-methyltransferase SETMAR n=1 Tax=Elysia marginata TaxID=1093978 RepID=A0AAV4FJP1_9GAST|nr:histone-lysine N-methyltransferase SETMAR [Elysia marginata]
MEKRYTPHIGVGPGEDLPAKNNLLDNLDFGDETWVHLNTPETKLDSMTWKHPSFPVTKKCKEVCSQSDGYRVVEGERCGPLRHIATGSVYQRCPVLEHSW